MKNDPKNGSAKIQNNRKKFWLSNAQKLPIFPTVHRSSRSVFSLLHAADIMRPSHFGRVQDSSWYIRCTHTPIILDWLSYKYLRRRPIFMLPDFPLHFLWNYGELRFSPCQCIQCTFFAVVKSLCAWGKLKGKKLWKHSGILTIVIRDDVIFT